ncbi:hypothetical protein EIP91_010338 [Steccherinum ochraceum]|uniref:Uncharacterized protein n=1 Tax=Steccherinum ochraceum TaxID=92696 RepID=A0A4R0R0R6_9APHY|nr:hypothetical protein EIP91_010338 [Steccherinum ochraceum]
MTSIEWSFTHHELDSPYKDELSRGRELAWRCAAAIDALPRGFAEEWTYDQWQVGLLLEMGRFQLLLGQLMLLLCRDHGGSCPALPPVIVVLQGCIENDTVNLYKFRQEMSTIARPEFEVGWDDSLSARWWDFDEDMDDRSYMPAWWKMASKAPDMNEMRVVSAGVLRMSELQIAAVQGMLLEEYQTLTDAGQSLAKRMASLPVRVEPHVE